MAYADQQQNNSRRTGAIVAVVGIHAAMGYALVTGLAHSMVERIIQPNPDGVIIDLPPPPPPPPPKVPPEAQTPPTSPQVKAPLPPMPLPRPDAFQVDTFDPADVIIPSDPSLYAGPAPGPANPPAPTPKPAPSPSFKPVAAQPSNSELGWVTTNDYPSTSLRREEEGRATYRLSIGTDGRVSNCAITRSSGHSRLDEATCKAVSRRARFNAAVDSAGVKTTGSFSGTVTWRIPD